MRFVDFDFDLIEDTFRANEKITRCRIGSPYDRRSAVDLSAELTRGQQKVQDREITSQDGVFGVFDVFVLHVVSVVGPGGSCGGACDTPPIGSEVHGENETLLDDEVMPQILPRCLPINLYESRDIQSKGVV